ncbi:protein FAM174C isoform X2 [Pristis pectinata]|uniref:protein FAM174C isoform X2 n=1 Tax=Pristis pectinata TaxID=685728 RepID=UPI00223D8177|nr:protein FAM174C isoform X2 [Pristis pectinata]
MVLLVVWRIECDAFPAVRCHSVKVPRRPKQEREIPAGGSWKMRLDGDSLGSALAAVLCLALLLPGVCPEISNVTVQNGSGSGPASSPPWGNTADSSVITRAVAVVLAISGLGLVYLLVRGLRLKKTQRKKYGLLSSFDDHVEMAPMDTDDDDTTLFEAKIMRRSVNYTASQSC